MLSVSHLTFQYPRSQAKVLKDLTFSIDQGEVFGFLGPSGSGKSTTQQILYKQLTSFEGEVEVAGKPIQDWNRDFFQKIGVCFELPNHYLKLTARENLSYFSAFYDGETGDIDEWLDKVGLLPDADKRVAEFSKGMKVRLNFIRAVIHQPELLFLDEPTSGLDPVNAKIIKDLIREEQQKGTTIFLTTHNMYDADQLCDRVALLHEGAMVAQDNPTHLKLQHGKSTVSVTTKDGTESTFDLMGLATNSAFQKILSADGIQTIHSQEATLEDVFIKITGEQLVR